MAKQGRILITGGTGLIGLQLSRLLRQQGYEVRHLSRQANPDAEFPAWAWHPAKLELDPQAAEGCDCIIHLAGAGIADARWTEARKRDIIESRVQGLQTLAKAWEAGHLPQVKTLVAASAVGFYGDRGAERLTEASSPGKGFLAETCIVWEAEAKKLAELAQWRLSILRVGIVLSTQGGALAKMLPSYKLRTGAYFGSGEQYYPWIHIEDLARMFLRAIEDESLRGIFNATAPEPLRNRVLAEHIATALRQKALILPAPAWGLRLAMGEMAEAVLISTRAMPERFMSQGFEFKFPEPVLALRDLIKRQI